MRNVGTTEMTLVRYAKEIFKGFLENRNDKVTCYIWLMKKRKVSQKTPWVSDSCCPVCMRSPHLDRKCRDLVFPKEESVKFEASLGHLGSLDLNLLNLNVLT